MGMLEILVLADEKKSDHAKFDLNRLQLFLLEADAF